MKSITIKGQERESVGKKSSKAVRDAGMVPCVLYGGGQPVHFAAEEKYGVLCRINTPELL